MNTLHIYGQWYWHDEAFIYGTREALLELFVTVERALNHNESTMETFTNDGEGYQLTIRRVDEAKLDSMNLPYAGEIE